MKISSFIITMLLVSGVIISLYSFSNTLSAPEHYNIQINSSYQNTYDKVNDLQKVTNDTLTKIQSLTPNEDRNFFTGTWDALVITKDVIVGAVSGTVTGLGVGTTLATDFVQDVGVAEDNSHVSTILVTILSVLIVGALIAILINRDW
jgi:hypothetical protein